MYVRRAGIPEPGKRPEKLRFDLSLLFTKDGEEFSIQEARAKSMGLLGKKWGPPPDAQSRQLKVGFEESTARNNTRNQRKGGSGNTWMGGGAEPTVTIATKEALADVFGMYNSPEKSMRYGVAIGSKHAPVKKIDFGRDLDPVTPSGSSFKTSRDENADIRKQHFIFSLDFLVCSLRLAFRPYVDPSAQKKENNTPGPSKVGDPHHSNISSTYTFFSSNHLSMTKLPAYPPQPLITPVAS